MLEIDFIRENPESVKKDLEKRGEKEIREEVDELLKHDKKWRELKTELDKLRHKRNKMSENINKAKKEGKEIKDLVKKAKELPEKIRALEEEQKTHQQEIKKIQMNIPNILHESVPVGKDDTENVEFKKWGKPQKYDFELLPHGELMERSGAGDFKRAAKTAGAGFVYVKEELALLDLALQRFAIDFLREKGFKLVEPPMLMNREAYEGVTDLESFETVMYKIDGEEMYLIATSEHPLGAMYKDEVLKEEKLPIKLCGISACFRREIGSHGVDSRGLNRMHQFNKVEQFIFSKPKESWKIHEKIQKNSEEMIQALGIPYRVVNVCTGDMGSIAAKKYDIEAWFPREKKYGEIGSNSNCTSYQAVRLNVRYENKEGKRDYVHTLNNTGIATSRVMRAILENFQNKDGSVDIPKVLWPYMSGIKKIALVKKEKQDKKRKVIKKQKTKEKKKPSKKVK